MFFVNLSTMDIYISDLRDLYFACLKMERLYNKCSPYFLGAALCLLSCGENIPLQTSPLFIHPIQAEQQLFISFCKRISDFAATQLKNDTRLSAILFFLKFLRGEIIVFRWFKNCSNFKMFRRLKKRCNN